MLCESIFHRLVGRTFIEVLKINFSKLIAEFAMNLPLTITYDNVECLRHYFQDGNTFPNLEVNLVSLMVLEAARSLQ